MSRYINADEIENAKLQEENLRGIGEHIAYRVGWNEAIESILENAPSIDIVRCGECKYYEAKEDWCYWRDESITANDFCSYGCRDSEKPNNSND